MRQIVRRRPKRPMCPVCLIFVLTVYITLSISPPQPSFDVDAVSGLSVTVEGTAKDIQQTDDISYIYLKDVSFITDDTSKKPENTALPKRCTGIKVCISDSTDSLSYVRSGSRVRARGVLVPFEVPTCEGQFDKRTYYLIRGYEAQLKRARITGVSRSYHHIPEYLRRIRNLSSQTLYMNMSAEDAGLVAAMTLGDRTGLEEEIKELYQNAGISHVLALSGLHIASVGLAILSLLRKTGLGLKCSTSLAGTIITIYALMTGMSTSTVRALLMFLLSVISILLGRTYDLKSAAAFSAVIILICNPRHIHDSGFLLSFLAVMAIAYVYPLLVALPKVLFPEADIRPAAEKIYSGICISLSVTLVTLPVTAKSFMKISVCSVIINLAVIPLMGCVLFTGFTGMILGDMGINSSLILKITHYILLLYRFLAEKSEKIPGNTFVTGQPGRWQIITYAVLLITATEVANHVVFKKLNNRADTTDVDRVGRQNPDNNVSSPILKAPKIAYVIENERCRHKKRVKKAGVYVLMVVVTVAAVFVLVHKKRQWLEIRNVDVGQGDCSLIWGKDVPAAMIDGGSSDVKGVGKYRIVPVLLANRIQKLDYCFLTHMDSDHVSGVIEMLEDDSCPVRIRNVIISDASASYDDSDNLKRLRDAANRKNTRILTISAGDLIDLNGTRIACLSPPGHISGSFDANAASIVLYLTKASDDGGFSALFTGDIGEQTERCIRSKIPLCTYLKVAHHGSATSSTDDFLKKAQPLISVISVGAGNSYGHPSPKTLERLNSTGTRIYRTDEAGEVITYCKGSAVTVRTMN